MTNSERGQFAPTDEPTQPTGEFAQPTDSNQPTDAQAPPPGRAWGIAGLVLAIVPPFQLAGLVVSAVGLSLSLRRGRGNLPAVAGILISMALILAAVTLVVAFATEGFAMFGDGVGAGVRVCDELGPGMHIVDGLRYTCP